VTREAYVHQLHGLRDDIVAMSSMIDKALVRSVEALRQQDLRLAEDIIRADQEINRVRWDIEERALLLIATQAPMARDLRLISAIIHIATELERMGDHAAGNAKIVIETGNEPLLKPLVDIPRMSDIARSMLSDSISAFIIDDADAARAIVDRDDDVDDLYNQIYRELLTFMMADPTTINRATHLLWAAHNFERIADRVTNICERVVFAATGKLDELAVSNY
jgi:phosphate transport system protein